MPNRLIQVICLAFLVQVSAPSQETKPTLEPRFQIAKRVDASPQQRFRGGSQRGVYKSRITPQWIDDGTRFWYRNDLTEGKREFILVDVRKGQREPAFDHERLARALREAGVDNIRADRFALDGLQFETDAILFRTNGKVWRCDLKNYELSPLERELPADSESAAMHPDDAPRASRRTGPETEIRFVNQTGDTVRLFWVDTNGGRRSYGTLAAGAEKQQHTYAGHVWLVVDDGGNTIAVFEAPEQPGDAVISGKPIARQSRQQPRRRQASWFRSGTSPDGKWRAFVRDGNLFLSSVQTADGDEIQLTEDGTEQVSYGRPNWAPNSRSLVSFRTIPGEQKEVYLVESSPRGGGRAVLHQRPYALPGDKFSSYELSLFTLTQAEPSDEESDVVGGDRWQTIKSAVDPIDFGRPRVRWSRDGSRFTYTKIDRGHQRYRLIEVDASTGQSRHILDEQSDTFIWTAHTENVGVRTLTWLEATDEIIYVSEVDGCRHLYLIDPTAQPVESESAPQIIRGEKRLFAPGLKNQITNGEFVVRGVDRIDEEKRQVWFRASGRNANQDPYFIHYFRVNFDGTGLVQLTEGNGNHSIQFSPDREFIIDTYSRVDMAPVHELRRADDGKLVCELEKADIDELSESGWEPPEVFVAKGRDGTTDIWGIICRPRDFDPTKTYPVIEDIYAGPHGSFVPKSFSSRNRYTSLCDLGFIVVKIDGMGTANRSKAFHDVCWHNLKDAGFPDRIRWMKTAATMYPQMDLSRVGIYGGSAGGQNAAGAVLFHGDFYKAAVAGCGCHDNRMDKASWNEQWMGYPVQTHYSECSNIDNAHRLRGELMLIVGEMDTNVPPESTMRFADALIKADKDFDLVVVPGAGHGMGGRYGQRRMHDFFVRHLLDDQPAKATSKRLSSTSEADTGRTKNAENRPTPDVADPSASPTVHPARKVDRQPAVIAPPESFFELVRERDRDAARDFYRKYIDVAGMPVVAAEQVDDEALQRTYSIVTHMLAGRPDITDQLVDSGMYLIIIGKDQVYTDMPENRNARNPDYLNERVRGTGGRPTSFGEENLLGWPIDRYDDESIAVHEFCHTIDRALRSLDPAWSERRNTVYENAMAKGLWKNAYAASNPGEYWAEIAQTYFDSQRVNNWNHGPIGTREQLKEYDPEGYELVRNTFRLGPDQDWRYQWPKQLPNVAPPPEGLKIDSYYTKFTWAREFTVMGREASDEALLNANDVIRKMFAYRHDILKSLIADGVRLVVLGQNESLSDLPEFASLESNDQIDVSARTLNYSPETKLLVVSEENVLGDPADPMIGSNQVIRVFADAAYQVCAKRPVDPNWENRGREVQQYELRVERLDERFDEDLAKLYEQAIRGGKWQGTTAMHDPVAYWTAGVLAYFDALGQDAAPHDAAHPIDTREALKQYDPELFALVSKTMAYEGHVDWRFRP